MVRGLAECGDASRNQVGAPAKPSFRCGASGGLAHSVFFWHTIVMRQSRKREFSVIVERDAEGYYVASVPALPGCHTQARSLDKVVERIREAIELCLEVDHAAATTTEFIGVQRVSV